MEWDEEKTLKLIKLYHVNDILWNPNHTDHKSRQKRFDALNEIASHLNTDVSEIERKIKNLTSQYYRERKKVIDSKKSGTGTDTVYRSKWFAYKSFSFLQNKNTPTATTDTETKNESNDAHLEQNDSSHSQQNYSPPSLANETIKRVKRNPTHEMVSKALNVMRSVAQRQSEAKERDEHTLFGEYIAAKLRSMDKSTNAIVRHKINNIIFETEIGYQTGMYADYASSHISDPGDNTGSPNDQTGANLSNR